MKPFSFLYLECIQSEFCHLVFPTTTQTSTSMKTSDLVLPSRLRDSLMMVTAAADILGQDELFICKSIMIRLSARIACSIVMKGVWKDVRRSLRVSRKLVVFTQFLTPILYYVRRNTVYWNASVVRLLSSEYSSKECVITQMVCFSTKITYCSTPHSQRTCKYLAQLWEFSKVLHSFRELQLWWWQLPIWG